MAYIPLRKAVSLERKTNKINRKREVLECLC